MRIGIDASSLLPPRAGVGRYAWELTCALSKAPGGHEFRLLLNSLRRPTPSAPFLSAPGIHVIRRRIPGPLLMAGWRFLNVPSVESLVGPVDVFHSLAGCLPSQKSGARVATIHDAHWLKRPEHSHWLGGGWLRATLPRDAGRWTRVIVPSEAARRDILRLIPLSTEQVHVVPEGVDQERFRPIRNAAELERARRAIGLPETYILFVGTLEPRKNLPSLVEAWAILARGASSIPPLVLAGAPGWKMGALRAAIRREGLQIGRQIYLTGPIDGDLLPALYGGAMLFALPSFDEGFGLTLLEAMSCGVPCAITPVEALGELAGGAAQKTQDFTPRSLADAMRALLESGARRQELAEAGRERARAFTWERCAQLTIAAYEEAAAENRRIHP